MIEQTSVLVKAGLGIIGDRYAAREGTYSGKVATRKSGQKIGDEERQITFISLPGIGQANQILKAQGEQPFTMAETRRSVVVSISAEALNNLEKKRFRFGGIEFEGIEKCDPCKRPPRLAGRPKNKEHLFEDAFTDRGGLRARILNDGRLHAGDSLKLPSA
ncbi:hypothetical protein A3E73_02070 [Candidatus Beckwithbacteria bacterium RIFCSPHIGHO2_12_FULL_47_17]|uniref:MOSC domain-containing protein n=1 Tax=Candidatus Beckwithbacteria bacterium RIFCSPHIGHO2_12_FULL_47_17 TaxID=1797460 RepID=A0A1F5DKC7_9BACT|nr:MAG: hypothetical protein A3E73_02070 [Candidatus Beckwithbacteria bacterium RIFCSPHIGHO2_12_FULL_47_17]